MREFLFHPALTQLANLFILAGLSLVLFAIFSREGGELEPNPQLRVLALMLGVLLLVAVYGIRGRIHGNHLQVKQHPQATAPQPPTTESAPPQPIVAAPSPPEPSAPAPARRMPPQPLPVKAETMRTTGQAPRDEFFLGSWRNANPNARDVVFVKVQRQDRGLLVRAWGACDGQLRDWGSQQAELTAAGASVTWGNGPVHQHMLLRPDGDRLWLLLERNSRSHPTSLRAEEVLERQP